MKSRECSYSLSVCTDMYLFNARTFSPQYNKSVCKYELTSCAPNDASSSEAQHQDVEVKYMIRTNSKSELKLRMAVYGLRFGKTFKLHTSMFGRYAELDVVSVTDNLDK